MAPVAPSSEQSILLHCQWEHFLQRHFPLPQAYAHDRQVALGIDTDDASFLVEARHAHPVVRLEALAGFTQSRCLIRFLLKLGYFLPIFLALAFGLVLSAQRFLARLFRFFAGLLQLSQAARTPLPATQVAMSPAQQLAWQLEPPGNLEGIAHPELA